MGPKKSEVEVSDAVGTISLFFAAKPPPIGRLGLDLDEDRADLFRQLHPGPQIDPRAEAGRHFSGSAVHIDMPEQNEVILHLQMCQPPVPIPPISLLKA